MRIFSIAYLYNVLILSALERYKNIYAYFLTVCPLFGCRCGSVPKLQSKGFFATSKGFFATSKGFFATFPPLIHCVSVCCGSPYSLFFK